VEALILIFGELIFAALTPLVVLVVDLIGSVFAFLFSFIPFGRREPRSGRAAPKKVFVALLVIAAILLGTLLVVNQFFFASSVRAVFDTLERRSGIQTACAEIDGSLFFGRIALGDCTIVRREHSSSEFDLALGSVELDLDVFSLFGTAELETAHVVGLRGSVNRHQAQDGANESDAVQKPRRAFVIQDLNIDSVDIALAGVNQDGAPYELPIRVASATSAPLRSQLALFDILFRSNANGSVAGADFEIKTSGDADGRQTYWSASQVPVADFGAMVGGTLAWFKTGVVDINIVDSWRRVGPLAIDMDWKLRFSEVEVQAPDSSGMLTKLATGPIVDYVNSHDGEFPFEFQMVVNEAQFEYQSSLQTAGLWTAVGESVNSVLARYGIGAPGSATETGNSLKEGARSVLDRLRQPKDNDEDD
jgi:hypothetical protein